MNTYSTDKLIIGKPIKLETDYGIFILYHVTNFVKEGVMIESHIKVQEPIPLRIQSSCLFSESLFSIDCDCSCQLAESLKIISVEGGFLLYIYDEGRGAGLMKKMEAIRLQQEKGIDTASAFIELGLEPDLRKYVFACAVINKFINNKTVELLTNNPNKINSLKKYGINVVKKRSLIIRKNSLVINYLKEKSIFLGHQIDEQL